jgi:hypothetical protein
MSKKFYPIEPLDDGCVLGKKATGKNAYWYVRMYWKDAHHSTGSTFLSREPPQNM